MSTSDASPAHRSAGARVRFGTTNRLKLGLFGANLAGIGMTAVPERWMADWDANVAVARMAEEAGFDFLLPVARWKGYGGTTDPQGTSLETITWATALLALTQRITVFATVHVPLINPVLAAKQCVTADHVGKGRFGLNIVCGWNDDEFQMFGVPRSQETRYEYAREWLDAVKDIWARTDTFDVEGSHIRLNGVRAMPKPYGDTRPVLLNAGQSPEGTAFALDNCDVLFSAPPGRDPSKLAPTIDRIRTSAGKPHFPIFTACVVICRKSRQEAEEFQQYCTEHADEEAVNNLLAAKQRSGRAIPAGELEAVRRDVAKATAVYLVGSADDVTGQLEHMHASGANGVAMMFTNQLLELPFFNAEVLPRLQRMGLRSA